jgi:hypothetical protein
VAATLDRLLSARERAEASRDGVAAALDELREALALWIDTAAEVVEKAAPQPSFEPGLLGDSGGSVAAMLRGSGA